MSKINLDPDKVKAKRKEKFSSLKVMSEESKKTKNSNDAISERTLAKFESNGKGTVKSAKTLAMLLETDLDSLRIDASNIDERETPTIDLRDRQLFGYLTRRLCQDIEYALSMDGAPFGIEKYFDGKDDEDNYWWVQDTEVIAIPCSYPKVLGIALGEYGTLFGSCLTNQDHDADAEFPMSVAIPLSPIWLAQDDLYLSADGIEVFDEFQRSLSKPDPSVSNYRHSAEGLAQILRTKSKAQSLYEKLHQVHDVAFFTCELHSECMSDWHRKNLGGPENSENWVATICKRPVICLGHKAHTKINIKYKQRTLSDNF